MKFYKQIPEQRPRLELLELTPSLTHDTGRSPHPSIHQRSRFLLSSLIPPSTYPSSLIPFPQYFTFIHNNYWECECAFNAEKILNKLLIISVFSVVLYNVLLWKAYFVLSSGGHYDLKDHVGFSLHTLLR